MTTANHPGERALRPERTLSCRERFCQAARLSILSLVRDLGRVLRKPPARRRILSAARGFAAAGLLERLRAEVPELGVFGGLPISWVEAHVDALIEEGYLEPAAGGASPLALRLSDAGGRALESCGIDPGSGPGRPPPDRGTDAGGAALAELRKLRAAAGAEEGRPAFSVLPNAVLAEIVARRPRDLGSLAGVPGMGTERLRRYGRRILRILRAHGRDRGASPGPRTARPRRKRRR